MVSIRFSNFQKTTPLIPFDSVSTELARHWPESKNDKIFEIINSRKNLPLPTSVLKTFLYVRNVNRRMFENIEGASLFEEKAWHKTDEKGESCGGGVMSVGRGKTLEKVAVNMSVVWGPNYPAVEGEHAGKPYTAGGVSLICHPNNPFAPIVHMNVRFISVGDSGKEKTWIGGGADLTPMVRYSEDTQLFHDDFRKVCENNRLGDYPKFKTWCDEYFFIKHRNESRGVGGIFFDYLNIEKPDDFGLLLDVGQQLAHSYGTILSRRVELPFTDEDKEKQLYWRARYAEFNLLYDRGTRFGLLSGGNIEAIFCSMPPLLRW